jgi:hypothetical protein
MVTAVSASNPEMRIAKFSLNIQGLISVTSVGVAHVVRAQQIAAKMKRHPL